MTTSSPSLRLVRDQFSWRNFDLSVEFVPWDSTSVYHTDNVLDIEIAYSEVADDSIKHTFLESRETIGVT